MSDSKPISVLYMEDDPGVARLTQKKLTQAGYVVDIARDGEQGLAMYDAGSYDVVAIDQAMPVHDGLEVVRILASQGPLPPTIMVTGSGNERVAVEAMKLGVSDYIVKDVEGGYFELLPSLIQQVLRQRRLAEEKQQADEALRGSEERYRLLVENAPLGVLTVDAQGQIMDLNHALLSLVGSPSAGEFRGMNLLNSPTFVEAGMASDFRRCLQSGESGAHERCYVAEGGKRLYLRYHLTPTRDAGGQISGVQAIIEDITQQKQLEERMRQRDRMEALGQLAGGVAHDFNNILTGITLAAQMLQNHRYLPPDMISDLQTILDEAGRASRLVRQILDFSRRSFFETQPVDLGTLVRKTSHLLKRTLPESIHLLLELGTGDCVVSADPTRMQQVLTNLAINARDAMPEGGELRIGLSRVLVQPGEEPPMAEMPHGAWVCLSISDTGSGMSGEVVSHLFEPFFTTKPVGQGSGLGLAQVHGIVEQHEGYIGVETEEGRGTTFRVYLPALTAEKTQETPEGETSAPPRQTRETILLVEDEEMVRRLGRRVLEAKGYRVLTAANGQEALQVYRLAERVDLLLADMMMPEMGGRELLRELRVINPNLKGLIITGYMLDQDLQELKKEGIMDVVPKPFTVAALADAVRRALAAN